MQSWLARLIDEVMYRYTVRAVQLHRRTLHPDPALLTALRTGRSLELNIHDPGPPPRVKRTPLSNKDGGEGFGFHFDSTPPYGQEHYTRVYGVLFAPERPPLGAGGSDLSRRVRGVNLALGSVLRATGAGLCRVRHRRRGAGAAPASATRPQRRAQRPRRRCRRCRNCSTGRAALVRPQPHLDLSRSATHLQRRHRFATATLRRDAALEGGWSGASAVRMG